MTRWAALVALAGCNQVFGLEETIKLEDRGSVTGVYKLRWAENDMAGAPIIREGTYAVDELSADVVLEDGTRRDVALDANGTLSFTTAEPDQPYSLTFRTAYFRTTYQLVATAPVLVDRIAARPDRELVPRDTELVYQVVNRPPDTLTNREEIITTGIWTRRQVTDLPTIRYDWSSASNQSAPLGLLDGTKYDDAYYVDYDRTAAHYRIMSVAHTRGTLIGGQSTMLTATAAALPPTSCAHVVVQSKQESDRVTALFDDTKGTLAFWNLDAAASRELGSIAFQPIAFGSASIESADVALDVDYANPFPGGARMLRLDLAVARVDSLASVSMFVPIDAECPTPTTIASGVVAVPTAIDIAGTLLATTDQFITVDRSKLVPVTWQTSPTGHADMAAVTLIEVIDANTSIARQVVVTADGVARLDPSELDRGRKYTVHVRLVDGAPDAGIGRFDVLGTMSIGSLLSTPFTIAN